jgi:hypothetical protein
MLRMDDVRAARLIDAAAALTFEASESASVDRTSDERMRACVGGGAARVRRRARADRRYNRPR